MSKFIVCSDIHGRSGFLRKALIKEKDVDGVIIAGDIELDPSEVADIIYEDAKSSCVIHAVAGNCDAYSPAASTLRPVDVFEINDSYKVFLTHGYRYSVPRTDILSYAAEEQGCNIVIFGHTHQFFRQKEAGILVLNPGALRNGEYVILTVDDDRIDISRRSVL